MLVLTCSHMCDEVVNHTPTSPRPLQHKWNVDPPLHFAPRNAISFASKWAQQESFRQRWSELTKRKLESAVNQEVMSCRILGAHDFIPFHDELCIQRQPLSLRLLTWSEHAKIYESSRPRPCDKYITVHFCMHFKTTLKPLGIYVGSMCHLFFHPKHWSNLFQAPSSSVKGFLTSYGLSREEPEPPAFSTTFIMQRSPFQSPLNELF
jgi:hypothetical protein